MTEKQFGYQREELIGQVACGAGAEIRRLGLDE